VILYCLSALGRFWAGTEAMPQPIGFGRGPAATPGLSALVDFAVGSHARAVVLLIAVALVALVPGLFHIPPVDRDEARFAQASRQMIETGDYVDIHFQNE